MAVQVLDMDLNCRTCDEGLKKERGCEEKGIIPFYIGSERYFRCPLKLITNVSWEYIKAYAMFKSGFLPNNKGWSGESEKFVDAMIILSSEFSKAEQDKAEKMRNRKLAKDG